MWLLLAQLFFAPLPEANELPAEIWRDAFIAERKNFEAINQANFQCLSDRRHYLSEAERFADLYNKCEYRKWKLEQDVRKLRTRIKGTTKKKS